jgi:glutathione synthase/RimK-type ligase-like ATP-grasp enzyme
VPLKSIKAKRGSQITLTCEFQNLIDSKKDENALIYHSDGDEAAFGYKILWVKENLGVISINEEIKLNKDKYTAAQSVSDSGINFSLTIYNLEIEDDGKYICQHFEFSIVKQFSLTVLGKINERNFVASISIFLKAIFQYSCAQ